ncbi:MULTISPECIES: Spy/CpxP family protein refolding chaperone [Oxalobacteraceae]|uniref:Spy/CpxP family protein refolding chaperone n=1 Tax=Oxalobacteraceae TaxID=75682 RepID=UPI001456227C|nr:MULTISPECIES: Spy/CpxP family protein refolding chaperone [Oxalobacteraceae]
MMKFRKQLLTGLVALGIGAGSFAAYAGGPGWGYGMGPGGDGGPARFSERMKERMEQRQAQLHDKLKLTAAQEPAWKTFTQKMQPGTPPAWGNRAELDKLSAPERMEKMLALMKDREQRMADHVVAVKDFYAVLTPEQQKIFNDEFAAGGHRRFRR